MKRENNMPHPNEHHGSKPASWNERLRYWWYGGSWVEQRDSPEENTISFSFHASRPVWILRLIRFLREDPKWTVPTLFTIIAAVAALVALFES